MSDTINISLKTAIKGTTLVLIGLLTSNVIWFATKILVVRNISKDELGIYSLVIAIVSIVSLIASLGLWEGVARYISIFTGDGRHEDATHIIRTSLRIGILSGIVACILVILFSKAISNNVFYKSEILLPLKVIAFFIPFNVTSLIIASVLRGYGIISPKVLFMDIGQPLFYLILLCPIFLLKLPFVSIIFAYVLSMSVVSILLVGYGHKKKVMALSKLGKYEYVAELLKFSIPVLSVNIMFLVFRWTDTLMLGRYNSVQEVGVYNVSVSLATLLLLPVDALGFVYLPIAGEMYSQNRTLDLMKSYRVLTRWIFSITLPIFFVFFFFPEMTITFLFGESFIDSAMSLRILSVGFLLNALCGVNNTLLLVLGLSKDLMNISAIGAIINVILNYVSIKHLGLGMEGAATSTMLSYFFINAGYSWLLYRHSRIHSFTSEHIKATISAGVIGVIIYIFAKSFPLQLWMLPLYFMLYTGAYGVSLVFIRALDNEDIFLLETILKKAGIEPEYAKRFISKIRRN